MIFTDYSQHIAKITASPVSIAIKNDNKSIKICLSFSGCVLFLNAAASGGLRPPDPLICLPQHQLPNPSLLIPNMLFFRYNMITVEVNVCLKCMWHLLAMLSHHHVSWWCDNMLPEDGTWSPMSCPPKFGFTNYSVLRNGLFSMEKLSILMSPTLNSTPKVRWTSAPFSLCVALWIMTLLIGICRDLQCIAKG